MAQYEFGQRLRLLRIKRELSLDELAMKAGSTKSTLSKYERGIMDPSLDVAKRLADFFMVSVDWISGAGEIEDVFASVPQQYIEVIKLAIEKNITAEKLKNVIELLSN